MAGLFGGYNIPDWMMFGQRPEEYRPNAVEGGTPTNGLGGPLFNDMWQPGYDAAKSGQWFSSDPSYPQPEQLAPRPGFPSAPSPQPPMYPGANQYAGQSPAMAYTQEQPRPQQPLANIPQQAPQQQAPSMGDRFGAAGENLLMMTAPMLGMALRGFQTGRTSHGDKINAQRAATQAVAADENMDPGLKASLLSSPDLAMDFVANKLKHLSTGDTTDYEFYARQERAKGRTPVSFEKFMTTIKADRQEKFGLTPQYSMGPKDENGNPTITMHQLGDRGGLNTPTLPGGQRITKPLVKEDTGLAINWRNPFDGTIVTSQPKSPQEIERQKKVGGGIAATQLKLPEIESTFDTMIGQINKVMSHKMLPFATGNIAGLLPDATPGFRDVRERIAQIGSQAWTQGIQKMAGFGALSNAEGQRIESATARLHTGKSTPEFKEALNELMQVLAIGRQNARMIASGQMQPYTGANAYNPGGGGISLRQKYGLE